MMLSDEYPGTTATPIQLRNMADRYAQAANLLAQMSCKGDHISRAPSRFNAIHAIELYLSAFLRQRGMTAQDVREMQHDLEARLKLAFDHGLALKTKTARHLAALGDGREYVVCRYAPEQLADVSHPTRLAASLAEVARKVSLHFDDRPVTGSTTHHCSVTQ